MICMLVEQRGPWILSPMLPPLFYSVCPPPHSYIKSLLVSLVTSIIYNKATQTKPDIEKPALPKTKYKQNLINLHSRVIAANLPRLEDWVHSTQGLRGRGKNTKFFSKIFTGFTCSFVPVNRNNVPCIQDTWSNRGGVGGGRQMSQGSKRR